MPYFVENFYLQTPYFSKFRNLPMIACAYGKGSGIYSTLERAEREETMIEIIQEENWDGAQGRQGLPKNIKQIGTPDMGDRIYIENSAYQKMHPYGQHTEKMVYVMLGRFDDFAGHTCIFVEDVVKMNEVEFNGRLPQWNDDSWGYLYRKIRPEHEEMIIVGWAVDICGQVPSMTAQLERIHQTYFGGTHQILFLMDTLEREEAFYSNRNGYLKRREGFYIYYDRSIPGRMESAMEALREEKRREEPGYAYETYENNRTSRREESYRDYLNSRRAPQRVPQPVYSGSYSSTLLLLVVILALGYSAFQNHQKMVNMERALNQLELQAVMQTEVERENSVRVEEVIGTVTPAPTTEVQQSSLDQTSVTEEKISSTQSLTSQMSSTQVEENRTQDVAAQTTAESEKYLSQGYYIVQAGDSLAGICRKIYHTTTRMDELCELNGIEDADAICAGQRLELPD